MIDIDPRVTDHPAAVVIHGIFGYKMQVEGNPGVLRRSSPNSVEHLAFAADFAACALAVTFFYG